MISQDRLQKALTYLAETDESCAAKKACMKALEKQEKTILAQVFMSYAGKGKTVAERDNLARISPEYKDWWQKYEDAICDYEVENNKRSTQMIIIDTWRSLNSSRNKGNIT